MLLTRSAAAKKVGSINSGDGDDAVAAKNNVGSINSGDGDEEVEIPPSSDVTSGSNTGPPPAHGIPRGRPLPPLRAATLRPAACPVLLQGGARAEPLHVAAQRGPTDPALLHRAGGAGSGLSVIRLLRILRIVR